MTDKRPRPIVLPDFGKKRGNLQFGTFLDRLMSCPNIRSSKFRPETALSIDIAAMLRRHTIRGSYAGVWCHIPNEGKRTHLNGMILRMMGLIAGATDYCFLWQNSCGMIEVKAKGNKKGLEQTQEDFRDWCFAAGVRWALCYSVREVEDTLLAWGAITHPLGSA